MKELLSRIQILENEMMIAEQQSDYWSEESRFDAGKVEKYEAESDAIYEQLYKAFEQAAEMIVSITSGQIDKPMAISMLRYKREDIEKFLWEDE